MMYMFNNCRKLNKLDLSNFDTSNVIDMQGMFTGCNMLMELNISTWKTSKVKNFSKMFDGCCNLHSLNISNFVTSNGEGFSDMFHYCASLKELIIPNFKIRSALQLQSMFSSCYNLKYLDIRGFKIYTKNIKEKGLHYKMINFLYDTDNLEFVIVGDRKFADALKILNESYNSDDRPIDIIEIDLRKVTKERLEAIKAKQRLLCNNSLIVICSNRKQ